MLSNLNTCQIGKETYEGVGVEVNIPIKIINSTFNEVQNYQNLEQIEGSIIDSKEILDTTKGFTGNIEFMIDEDNLGYFTQMANQKTSETTIGLEKVSVFNFENKNDVSTYTIEVSKGDFTQRFVGCRVNSLTIKNSDGVLIGTVEIFAKNGVTLKSVKSITSTVIGLDDVRVYKIGDVIEINSKTPGITKQTLTISGKNETLNTITTGTITDFSDYSNGYVTIKNKSVTFTTKQKARFFGKSNLTIDTNVVKSIDFEFVLSNNLENVYQIGDRSPSLILQGMRGITLKNTFHLESSKNEIESFLNGKEVDIEMKFETTGTKYVKFSGKGKYNGGMIDLSSGSQITIPMDFKFTEGELEIRGNVSY